MKRLVWILAAAAAALALAIGLFYVLLPRDALQTRLGEIIASWTGRDVIMRGRPKIDLFPRLTVTLHDVTIGGPPGMEDADLIRMDWLRGAIRFLPLIIGRVEIDSFKMQRPVLTLVQDGAARNWALDSGAAALQLAFAGDVPLGAFLVENGTILYEDRATGRQETFEDVGLELDWESIRTPIAVTGSAVWKGETITLDARADAPFDFVNDRATPLTATLESRPLSAVFNGQATELEKPRLVGELDLQVPSIGALAAWFGATAGPGEFLGGANLSGTAALTGAGLSMEGAQLSLQGGSARGALQVSFGTKPRVDGTLAFDRIDMTPYFDGLAAAWRANPANWRAMPVETAWLRGLDADLRLSAGTVRIGSAEFQNTAATLSLAAARLEIGLAHAGLAGGTLSGTVALSDFRDAKTSAAEATLRATEVAVEDVAEAIRPPLIRSGAASVSTQVSSSGRTFGALVENLNGSAGLTVLGGTLVDPGVTSILNGARERQPSTLAFDRLEARLAFADGAAMLESSTLRSPDLTVEMTGRTSLADGALALSGIVERSDAAGAPGTFLIGGTAAAPVVSVAALQ